MSTEKNPEYKIGEEFQRLTRYFRETLKDWTPAWDEQESLYKTYPQAERLDLPEAGVSGGPQLWSVIAARRSYRDFAGLPIGLNDLSQLLWACQGITLRTRNFEFRSSPSAGALYPVETYLVCNHVEGAQMGLYHYSVAGHKLELLKGGDLREPLMKAGLMQPVLFECAAAFLWTAAVGRASWKYSQRAYRYIYLDAGHIAQNLCLAAEALGMGCCLVGAFFDEEVNQLLEAEIEREPILYLAAVGPRQGESAEKS